MKKFCVEASFSVEITATIEAETDGEAINKLKDLIENNSVSMNIFESDYDCTSLELRDQEFKEVHYMAEEKQ